MLSAIHSTVVSLLRERGHIDPDDVDVRFDVPSEEWVSSLTRPTISFFLFEVAENTEKRETSPQTRVAGSRAERRMPPRRIDISYMVSVLTADVEDEHELLWRVMATLVRYQEFPDDVLADSLRIVEPAMTARVLGREENRHLLDLWSALGTKPRPALCYVLTAPMDLALTIESPLVLTRTVRYRRSLVDAMTPPDVAIQIGGVVRDAGGAVIAGVRVAPRGSIDGSSTDSGGRYMLQGISSGPLVLSVNGKGLKETVVKFQVPAESYDIVLTKAGDATIGENVETV
jgi:hypothetical protein